MQRKNTFTHFLFIVGNVMRLPSKGKMQYQSHPGQEMGLCDEVTLAKKNSKLCVTHILFVIRRNVKRLPGKEQMNVTHFLLVIE